MRPRTIPRVAGAGAALLTAALLAGCGGSSKALIPTANAAALQNDVNYVGQFVAAGNCVKSRGWIAAAQRDLARLPASVNAGLVAQLQAGVADLATSAQQECLQNAVSSTSTTSATSTTSSLSASTSALTSVSSSTPATTSATSSIVTSSTASPAPTSSSLPGGGVSPPATTSTPAPAPGGGNQAPAGGNQGGNGNGGVGAP
jgi:hypothetical protein